LHNNGKKWFLNADKTLQIRKRHGSRFLRHLDGIADIWCDHKTQRISQIPSHGGTVTMATTEGWMLSPAPGITSSLTSWI